MDNEYILIHDSNAPENNSFRASSYFSPVKEWNEKRLVTIDEQTKKDKFKKQGKILYFGKTLDSKSAILAKIKLNKNYSETDNRTYICQYNIDDELPIKRFSQILYDNQFEFLNDPPLEIIAENENNNEIYIRISNNRIVGPYLLNSNIAKLQPRILNNYFLKCFNHSDIEQSPYYFDYNSNFYFIPDKNHSLTLCISDRELIEKILKKLPETNDIVLSELNIELTSKRLKKLCSKLADILTNKVDINNFISDCFQDKEKDSVEVIKDKLFSILNSIDSEHEINQHIQEYLMSGDYFVDEIEKYKQQQFERYIKEQENTIIERTYDLRQIETNLLKDNQNKELEIKIRFDSQIKEKEHILNQLSNKIFEEEVNKQSLLELNKKLRNESKELQDYIEKGEKWRKALFNNSENFIKKDKNLDCKKLANEIKKSLPHYENENIYDEKNIEQLFERIDKENDSSFNESEIIKRFDQLKINKFFYLEKFEYIDNMITFFENIGYEQGLFIINAEASWLTPDFFWNSKVYLKETGKVIKLIDLFEVSNELKYELIFRIVIQGADRAPIEGYLGQLIKAIKLNLPIIVDEKVIHIPKNMIFFLQLDRDNYTAKPSEWLNELITNFKIDKIKPLSIDVFVTNDTIIGDIE